MMLPLTKYSNEKLNFWHIHTRAKCSIYQVYSCRIYLTSSHCSPVRFFYWNFRGHGASDSTNQAVGSENTRITASWMRESRSHAARKR